MSQDSRLNTSTKMRNIGQAEQNQDNKHQPLNDKLRHQLEDTIGVLSNVLKEIEQSNHNGKNHVPHKQHSEDNQRNLRKSGQLPEKEYIARNSLLTDLMEIPHIRTIYHICIVILILLFCNTVMYDLVDRGSINVGFGLIRIGFGKMDTVIGVWAVMQLIAFLPHFFFRQWAIGRSGLGKNGVIRKLWDLFWLSCYVIFQVSFSISIIYVCERIVFPIASTFIVILEMVRFVMKIHAYVRSVSPRVLNSNSTDSTIALPPFSRYLYFLFAPTMVYRDSYPRTKSIRWGNVCIRLMEIPAIIFYMSFLIERFTVPHWSSFGTPNQPMEAERFVLSLFASMLPGLLIYLCGFYLLLHSWHNVTAELLTFADRRFYMDWWNQSSYAAFYRMWNMVVHDWLHTYIYKDVFMLTGNRLLSTLLVFTISAVIHEVVLTYAFGFFYPVLLIFFGFFGVIFIFLTRNVNHSVGNIFVWLTLATGNGLLWSMYSMEFFARKNCPEIERDDIFASLPRSWSCHNIVLKPDWEFQNPLTG